ncbi:MAG TPA: Zn-dependent alcohol dehydrogenase [Acidimicrobiales bacterium]|nr:Zn-dependent alcohol dehydrogenase [Acidimicrobiales bacterium]
MTRAAVLTALGQPLAVRDDVELEAPRAGEVRVQLQASGVCHTDLSMRDGVVPITLPAVLGHEGAGVVAEVGPDVTDVAAGDHVVVSWVPQCGRCYYCSRGQAELCEEADTVLLTGGMLDGTPRFRAPEGPVHQMCGCGTFATETVVLARAAVPVPADLDPGIAALLGCAVVSGVGAALNTASIAKGDAVAVVGCGGVGLNVVQGARIAEAGTIIAIDANPSKLPMAEALGATVAVDASRTDPVSAVMTLTAERGADVAFEVVGLGPTIDQAIAMTRRGGQTVLVGIPSVDVMLQLPAWVGLILQEKTIKGCWYGSADVRRDIPRLIELYRKGELQLDALVSRRIELSEVNAAFEALVAGEVARSVILF